MTKIKITMFLAALMCLNLAIDAYEQGSLYDDLNWGRRTIATMKLSLVMNIADL